MAKVNFTEARVEAHSCPAGKSKAFLWGSRAPGLGLRTTSTGAKAYIFQGKVRGRTVRMTIGDPRNWSIDKAQGEARRLQTLVDGGTDPREDRAEKRAEDEAHDAEVPRRDVTFGEAWDVYVCARKARWGEIGTIRTIWSLPRRVARPGNAEHG